MIVRVWHFPLFVALAARATFFAAQLAAQDPSSELSSPEPVAEPVEAPAPMPGQQEGAAIISTRQFVAALSARPAGENPLFEFLVTPQLFEAAEWNLRDLRVLDARNQEIPYAVRFRQRVYNLQEVRMQPFNESKLPDGSLEVSYDLGQSPEPHNELQVMMAGNAFRREVTLEGGDDGRMWKLIKEQQLIRFDQYVRNTITYPTSRFRYLRLRIAKDPLVDKEAVAAPHVVIRRRIEQPGEDATRTIYPGMPEPTRQNGVIGTSWVIDLGGAQTPCEKLTFDIRETDFARDYTLTALPDLRFAGPHGEELMRRRNHNDDGGADIGLLSDWTRFYSVSGTWQRRPGDKLKPLEIDLGQVRAGRLRLFVADHANPPLTIQSTKATAPVCAIIMPSQQAGTGPLNVYSGDPSSPSPRYDFARNLPSRPEPAPVRADLGYPRPNPAYVPPPLPFTERWQWLIHTVLGIACAVVAFLVYLLAQRMIAEHDARESHPTAAT